MIFSKNRRVQLVSLKGQLHVRVDGGAALQFTNVEIVPDDELKACVVRIEIPLDACDLVSPPPPHPAERPKRCADGAECSGDYCRIQGCAKARRESASRVGVTR